MKLEEPMKRHLACIALAALAIAGVGRADLCTIEAAPAATLLLPYFEVDIADPNGVDTFFSINNAKHYSVLAHVIVWTDMSVEALDFNVYLTGYDVQTIGMGMIVRDGILPVTYYDDDFSPVGAYSWDHDESPAFWPSCDSYLPYGNPALDAAFIEHLQSILTGGPSSIYGGRCGGYPHGDDIARGYVTVDVVADCTLLTPCDLGYFTISEGFLANADPEDFLIGMFDNALWGDWYMLDYASNFAQGDTLVHVESICADPEFGSELECTSPIYLGEISPEARPEGIPPAIFTLLANSFYARCSPFTEIDSEDPKIVLDLREPLATTYAARFYQNAAFSGGTDYLVWRDSLFINFFGDEDGFSCSSGPDWFPLNERQVVFFDEQENPETACTISPCPEQDILFPLEAQRVAVADMGVTPQSGWTYMNLNQVWSLDGPVTLNAQAWVTAVHSAEGRFSAGLPAVQLDSACDFTSVLLGPAGPDFPEEETAYGWTLSYYYYTQVLRSPEGGPATPRNPLR